MRALLIIGHGSTVNPDSSSPTHLHADEIRRRGLYDEVACAFWKEEPSMREIFYQLRSPEIHIVPNFISEGYFCQQILPRELQLDGPVTVRDGRVIYYTDPVGIHPSMTRLLLKRADEVAPGVPRGETTLIIVGHGTTLNENSTKAIEDQVALIRDGGYGFAEVLGAYMEEPPLIAKWDELAGSPNVVVVPFFIADGLHSYQDIPVLLGIESEPTAALSQNEVFRHNPHHLRGKVLYYSSAIGTESLMADVILDQIRDFKFPEPAPSPTWIAPDERIPQGAFTMGQVRVVPLAGDCGWLLCHVEDVSNLDDLTLHADVAAAREIGIYDDAGVYRPIKTAPNLKRGWKLQVSSRKELRLALDFFYPAALGFWEHYAVGMLRPVHLRETLGRQTGMYRFANTITDDQAQALVSEWHGSTSKCARRLMWQLDEDQKLTHIPMEKQPLSSAADVPDDVVPLLSVEACTHLVSAAREQARANFQAANKAGSQK
jgi:sirohydrochlorin cobaltochelatase